MGPSRRCVYGRRPERDFFRSGAERRQQVQNPGGGMGIIQLFPGCFAEVPIMAGQNDGAVGQAGDHRGEPGHCRVGTGGHQPDSCVRRLGCPGCGLGIDQRGLPGGGIHHAQFGQSQRPDMGDNFEEFQRRLPMLGKLRADHIRQGFGKIDFRLVGFVQQGREITGEAPSAGQFARRAIFPVHGQDQAGDGGLPEKNRSRRRQ
jgi:hypothetical protein